MNQKLPAFRHLRVTRPPASPPPGHRQQKAPLSRGQHHITRHTRLRSLQLELDTLLYRMIVTRQNRDRRKLSLQRVSIPRLAESRNILRLHKLVLQSLREHPRLAPPPHFLSAFILNNEIVRLPRRKTKLDHPRSVVANVELELHTPIRMNRKRRAQRRFALSIRRRRERLLLSSRTARKRNGSCTKERNDETICHHDQATRARANRVHHKVHSQAAVNLSTTRRSCNTEVTRNSWIVQHLRASPLFGLHSVFHEKRKQMEAAGQSSTTLVNFFTSP